MPSQTVSQARGAALISWLIRGLWFLVIPALLSGLTFRYGVPGPKSGVEGALGALTEAVYARPALVVVGVFLLYALLLRYWSRFLYGASLWLPRPEDQQRPLTARQAIVWAVSLGLAVLAAVTLRQTFYQPYRVLSASMLPTLQPGAQLLATRFAYGLHWPFTRQAEGSLPRRGDLVVFRKDLGPHLPDELVKRVIGLPGDTVEVRHGHPFINGWPIPGCDAGRYTYVNGEGMLDSRLVVEFLEDRVYLTSFFAAPDKVRRPYVVRPGEVYVLGDNRSNSSDSRFWNGGRGGGLELSAIGGRFDRMFAGVRRNGEADFSRLLKPIGLDFNLEGIDTSDLQRGVDKCLQNRPKQTRPPAATTAVPGQ